MKAALLFLLLLPFPSLADAPAESTATSTATTQSGDLVRADKNVGIPPPKSDKAIAKRLDHIFRITGWFNSLSVTSQEGVVTISGTVQEASQRDWAVNLAQDGEGVVAVIDKVQIREGPWFDLQPTRKELKALWKGFFAFIPHLVIALVMLALTVLLFGAVNRFSVRFWSRRLTHPVLADLMGKLGALPILLLGLYLILQVLNLTGLAFTLLGGTGAVGLVAGFAFKNILENYFSGIMLSLRKPFVTGDEIEVAGEKGTVFRMTTRGTTLVDKDGNHILIPNSTVFSNIIRNHTASPLTRVQISFAAGEGGSLEEQRDRALAYLRSLDAVARKPEAEVLAAEGGKTFTASFWINSRETNREKLTALVSSGLGAVMRGQSGGPAELQQAASRNVKEVLEKAARETPKNPAERDLLRGHAMET